MKTFFKVIPVVFVIALITGCSMGGETSAIVLDFGQGGNARAVGMGELTHVIVFSGPTGSKTVNVAKGGGSISVSVVPGTWNISVTAYYQDEVYAMGTGTAEVKAGKITNVSIQMTVVWTDYAGVPNEKPMLAAQGFDFNIYSSGGLNPNTVCVVNNTVVAYVEPGKATLPIGTDDFTWEWQVDGIPATLGVDPLYPSEYKTQPDDVFKKVTVVVTHPKYAGSVTLGPVYVYMGLDSTNWLDFAGGTHPDYPMTGYYVLLNDPLFATVAAPVGGLAIPFNGIFDGNGQTIDLYITTVPADGYTGLFACIGPSGIVKNLNVTGEVNISPITGTYYAGAVAGTNEGQIFNVSVTVGPSGIEIHDSVNNFTAYAGGIAGMNASVIANCSVEDGYVLALNVGSSPTLAGGITGENLGTIHHCWVDETEVSSYGDASSGAGGIAGQNDGSIQNCVVIGMTNNIGSTSLGAAGRIWGIGTPVAATDNFGGTYVLVDGSSSYVGTFVDKHGVDVNSFSFDEAWWEGHWGSVWGNYDEDKPWYWGSSSLPELWFN